MAFVGITTEKVRIGHDAETGEMGIQFKLVNRTGATSVKGSVLAVNNDTNNQGVRLQVDEYDAMAICAESGIANGSEMWCWKIGSRCQVLLKDGQGSTAGGIAICADTDGRAIVIAVPVGNPAQSDHFKEIGHVYETKTAGTNVLCLIDNHYL